jgi:hypothetical protein
MSIDDYGIAISRYEQTLTNFRHWDQIRWVVPYWFATLAGAYIAAITLFDPCKLSTSYQKCLFNIGLLCFVVFSVAAVWLMLRLNILHGREIDRLKDDLSQLKLSDSVMNVFDLGHLQFYRGWNICKTATIWFMAFIIICGLVSLVFTIYWISSHEDSCAVQPTPSMTAGAADFLPSLIAPNDMTLIKLGFVENPYIQVSPPTDAFVKQTCRNVGSRRPSPSAKSPSPNEKQRCP